MTGPFPEAAFLQNIPDIMLYIPQTFHGDSANTLVELANRQAVAVHFKFGARILCKVIYWTLSKMWK